MGLLGAVRRRNRQDAVAGSRSRSSRLEVVVSQRTVVSDRAVLLHLRLMRADATITIEPGSHVDLHLTGTLIRQYSLVDASPEEGVISVCVQKEDLGRGASRQVHDNVGVGDRLHISPPRNTFALKSGASRSFLLAGGVGITPLVSMAESLHRSASAFELHAYAPRAASLPLLEQLRSGSFAASVFPHFSDEGDSFRESGPRGLLEPTADGMIYACGPEGFIALARERALEYGWRDDQFVTERFSSAAPPRSSADGPFTVVAASTGQAMRVEATESIASVLERHGYETYRSCGQGVCGSCIVPVLAGVPDHRDHVQSEREHATHSQINVCCSRSLTAELTLDI